MSRSDQSRAPLARWTSGGKFVRPDGSTFVPFGGIYGNFLCIDWAGIELGQTRLSHMSPFGSGGRIVEFQDATDQQLRQWLRWCRHESMNFLRIFNRGEMARGAQDPLDIGGRVNPALLAKFKQYFDMCYEEGIAIHFVACQEPRCSVYMNSNVVEKRALPHYTADELAKLPRHRRRFLDPAAPRVTYDNYFTDPDVLQCHKDYLTDLANQLGNHPAIAILEIYNEQQWGDHFFWRSHDSEVRWSAEIIKHLQTLFPGIPATCSFAGFGITAQDPLLWIDAIPMDLFSPHIYQALNGTSDRADFAAMCDLVMLYSQPDRPTMIGETAAGRFGGNEYAERLTLRDLAWFSVLNNCPGFGMWQSRGYGEFEIPRVVMESIDFANFKPKPPAVVVDISKHVRFFQDLEKNPSKTCHLPEDVWCPHRSSDGEQEVHRYCVKMASAQLKELHDWAFAAIRRGIRYELTRHPEKFEKTWNPAHVGTHRLSEIYRPFLAGDRYQVKYLSSADDRTHVLYLRNFTFFKVGSDGGRTKNRPANTFLDVALAGGGEYNVEIWNLDTKVKSTRPCKSTDRIELGNTSDDFALVFRRK